MEYQNALLSTISKNTTFSGVKRFYVDTFYQRQKKIGRKSNYNYTHNAFAIMAPRTNDTHL